jgi:beta-aspartyl-peptidase (threonine type)
MTVLAVALSFVLPVVARMFGLNTPATDEAAIRAVLDSQVAAWNKGDLEGFMDGYWRDTQLSFISGDSITYGWEATRDRYQKKYFTPGPDGKLNERGELSFAELQVEGMSPMAAIVRGRYILKLSHETATGRFTLTFRRMAPGWRITSDHTSSKCPDEKKEEKKEKMDEKK